MRKINIIFILMALTSLFWFGCKPDELTSKSKGSGVDSTQLVITVTPVKDNFHYIVTATTPGTGMSKWKFGNGSISSKSTDTAYYPQAGTYTITLDFYNNGGTATKHYAITTTKTDYAFFTDALFTSISGGIAQLSGKDWQLDSLSTGHLGCGSSYDTPTNWWNAAPLAKSVVKVMYDDVINFNLNGLIASYSNHGTSYTNVAYKDLAIFSNPKINDTDYAVDFITAPGTWIINKKSDGNYLAITPSTAPIFPCYFINAIDNTYKITTLDADHMTLIGQAGGTSTFWQFMLIRKGYVQPRVTGALTNAATGAGNLQAITLTLTIPADKGLSVTSAKLTFGDGKDTTLLTNLTGAAPIVVNHRYMQKGTYTPTASVVASSGTLALTGNAVTFATNDPTYVPPAQNTDATTVYNDFDVEKVVNMQFTSAGGVDGTNATGAIVTNPDATKGPNRSPNVYKFMKTGSQWGNNFMDLPNGGRFDFTYQSTFTYLVYGTAGNTITFKLQNTDLGGNAYTTASADQMYTIKNTNMWELVTISFKGIAGNGETDITTGATTKKGYYNEICWLLQPDNTGGPFTYYIDKVTGPVVLEMK